MKVFYRLSVIIVVILFSIQSGFAQEMKPLRISLKIGAPNLIGVNLEYVTPMFDNKLAIFGDFSSMSLSTGGSDETFNFMYYALGANYYFFGDKGLYGGIGAGRISLGLDKNNINGYYNDELGNPVNVMNGKASISLGATVLQVKLGGRFVWGFFTLGGEVGYETGKIDDKANYTIEYGGNKRAVGTETVPSTSLLSGPMFALMLGFAF